MLHWRLAIGVGVGAAAFFFARLWGVGAALAPLVGWNCGAVVYLAATWRLFLTASEQEVRARAARQDETRGVILILVVVAVIASLGAILAALLASRHAAHGSRALVTGLAIATLVGSWALLQTIFALHYAHEHFRDLERRGPGAGIAFPGEPARSYLDFVYLAACIGATAQVSDPGVTSGRLRNLVTAHAVTAFFYNTAVLALGINIIASLLSS